MAKFIDHDADEEEQNIDSISEENSETEKVNLIRQGILEINQIYNKKIKLINRETATYVYLEKYITNK